MICWHCKASLEDPPWGKLSFREACDKCGAGLHSCRNCKFYRPGSANDCQIPGTEYVSDREKNNFCEEFSLLGKTEKKESAPKNRFDDLFK